MELPQAFLDAMKVQLGEEYPAFLACYGQPARKGLRFNPLKCEKETLAACLPFPWEPTPFSPLASYAPGDFKPGPLAAHHAGMCYAQEPSAAAAVTVLGPQPGERVLDLCAAPGGKSTQIATLLGNTGLLWSNEIVRSRAGALLSNLERMGAKNAVVSSCHPQTLCQGLRGYFHRVLVDAPCSGEGMFRRDPEALAQWTPQSPAACAQRQGAILDSAALAVGEGGVLVYSTCTFSQEENEGTVRAFLQRHPEFALEPIAVPFGRPALGMPALRIYPMDGGEGHFVAKFRRVGENPCRAGAFSPQIPKQERALAQALYQELCPGPVPEGMALVGGRVLLVPPALPELSGLGVLRAGVELAEVRGKRLEPCHGFFMSRSRAELRQSLDLSLQDPRLAAFLRGEEIDCDARGYTAVCVAGVTTGFGKASSDRLKNRYPKGLRNL